MLRDSSRIDSSRIDETTESVLKSSEVNPLNSEYADPVKLLFRSENAEPS